MSHLYPDGDALGSSLGLAASLQAAGVRVVVVNATRPLPVRYDFLPGFAKIRHEWPEGADLLVSVDCGSRERLGFVVPEGVDIIVIDHHATNSRYGKINIIDEEAPSASSVVWSLLKKVGAPLTADAATALYAALWEDTGGFGFSSVNHLAFELAVEMIDAGAHPGKIGLAMRERMPLSVLRLEGAVLSTFNLRHSGRVAVAIVSRELFEQTGAPRQATDEIATKLRTLASVELVLLWREEENGDVKLSLRSKEKIDCAALAQSLYGGGGHRRAAGAVIPAREDLSFSALVSQLTEEILGKIEGELG
ncbi:MAG: DHH family phosphoesterase [Campylobacterales bacterium]